MQKRSKIIMIIASGMLMFLFLFPLWKISLEAPQFPEGITMYIWINQVSGNEEHTLQNVNILNHYIGMQKIEPDSIAELQYFPYIIVIMCILGILAGFSGNSKLFLSWTVIMIILGLLGVYDFYTWLYDYGHNLDPKAPIKVPGMTYQPPLLGTKWLLNFKATSWPATGGIILGLSILMSGIAFFDNKKGEKAKNDETTA